MALDPSIITGIKPIQIDSPVNQLAQLLKVQSLQQEGRLGQAKLDEYQRNTAQQQRVRDMLNKLGPGATAQSRIGGLESLGEFDAADKIRSGDLNRQKIESEAKAKEWDTQAKKLDLAGQAFGHVRQNPTLENANQVLDYLGQNGVYSPETVAQYKAAVAADPTKIASLADTAFRTVLGAKEQLMKIDTRNLGGTTQTIGIDPVTGKPTVLNSAANTVSPDAALSASTARRGQDISAAATRRGQDMTDARARETLAQGKTPVGYRQAGDGTLVPIPGGPADPKNKPPTEFQGKSAAFGARAEEADKILSSLQGKYNPAGISAKNSSAEVWGVGGVLSAGLNAGLSDASQRADQAQRDFVNAVLRQESGAAIGAGEFDNARKQYFPQPGDSAAVIQQKAANRKLAVQGLKTNAGHAAFSAPPEAPAAEHAPEIESLLKKYGQ